jgi:hypothetical protein
MCARGSKATAAASKPPLSIIAQTTATAFFFVTWSTLAVK